MRIGQRPKPDIAETRLATANQNRRAIDQQAVDLVGLEERRGRQRATFDQQVTAKSGRKPQNASGTMAFSRPGKFRWTYDKPY